MPDRQTNRPPTPVERRVSLERWENEGGADDESCPVPVPPSDLNALLAREQTAIMSAEAAADDTIRDEQREVARETRALVDMTPFPRRDPHDFERALSTEPSPREGSDDFVAELEALKRYVDGMEKDLAILFSEGRIGRKHNTFEHRSRLVRQARGRLTTLEESFSAAL